MVGAGEEGGDLRDDSRSRKVSLHSSSASVAWNRAQPTIRLEWLAITAFACSMDDSSALVPTRVWAHLAAGRRTTTVDEHSSHLPPHSATNPAFGTLVYGDRVGCAHDSWAALYFAWTFRRLGTPDFDLGWRSSPLAFSVVEPTPHIRSHGGRNAVTAVHTPPRITPTAWRRAICARFHPNRRWTSFERLLWDQMLCGNSAVFADRKV